MLPDPLHPMMVHFPIVLTVLLPVVVACSLWLIRRGLNPRRVWMVPIALAAAVTLSSWVAAETGEADEERVESVVPEVALATHEESAERFLMLSLGVLGVAGLGLVGGRWGLWARRAGLAAAAALVVAGYQVGHSGGSLVYQFGAGSAYSAPGGDGNQGAAVDDHQERDDRPQSTGRRAERE